MENPFRRHRQEPASETSIPTKYPPEVIKAATQDFRDVTRSIDRAITELGIYTADALVATVEDMGEPRLTHYIEEQINHESLPPDQLLALLKTIDPDIVTKILQNVGKLQQASHEKQRRNGIRSPRVIAQLLFKGTRAVLYPSD